MAISVANPVQFPGRGNLIEVTATTHHLCNIVVHDLALILDMLHANKLRLSWNNEDLSLI